MTAHILEIAFVSFIVTVFLCGYRLRQMSDRFDRLMEEVKRDRERRRESLRDLESNLGKYDAILSNSTILEYPVEETPVEETFDYRHPIAPKTPKDIH